MASSVQSLKGIEEIIGFTYQTLAFKDRALSRLPYLMTTSKRYEKEDKEMEKLPIRHKTIYEIEEIKRCVHNFLNNPFGITLENLQESMLLL